MAFRAMDYATEEKKEPVLGWFGEHKQLDSGPVVMSTFFWRSTFDIYTSLYVL